MIQLGSVVLSPSMLWVDRDSFSPVAQTMKRTLGGTLVLFSRALSAGRPITLEAQQDTGWITRDMLDGLTTMASTPGGVYTFEYHGFFSSVVFRHDDPPAVEFSPIQPRAVPLSGDYYTGALKLLTV
jgi:hypothetical protein